MHVDDYTRASRAGASRASAKPDKFNVQQILADPKQLQVWHEPHLSGW